MKGWHCRKHTAVTTVAAVVAAAFVFFFIWPIFPELMG